jgi:hypothetical protein
MPTEVRSPVSIKGSKVGSGQPMGLGARSNPSRRDSVPEQERHTSTHNEAPEPRQQPQGAGKEPERGLAVEE